MPDPVNLKMRTVPWFLVLAGGMVAFFPLLYLANGLLHNQWFNAPLFMVEPLLIWLLAWYWALTIEVKDGVLTYTTLLWRRTIRVSEIEKAWVETRPGYRAETMRYLFIQPKDFSRAKVFRMFLNRFDPKEVRKLRRAVNVTPRRN